MSPNQNDESGNYIPLSECQGRYLYEIDSRNLSIGVYNPDTKGFIGIRTKFGDRYLFTEYHWDTGSPPYGTVQPIERTDLQVPVHIQLWEHYPQCFCGYCGARIKYEEDDKKWEHYHMDSLDDKLECTKAFPRSIGVYSPLYDILDRFEKDSV